MNDPAQLTVLPAVQFKKRRQPWWVSDLMEGESITFIVDPGHGPARARLLFPATTIVSVCSPSRGCPYHEGRDWVWEGDCLVLPATSTIPFWTSQELTPPLHSQPYGLVRRDGTGDILFGATHEYHDRQIEVTYRHCNGLWQGPVPGFAGEELPHLMRKLASKTPITLAVFGDSISTGCNASAWAKVAPFQPGYPELVQRNLESAYSVAVTLRNLAVSGMTSTWGLEQVAAVAATQPDLVIIAWGMNDGNAPGLPAAEFANNIAAQMIAIQAASPLVEFILVAGMLPNDDWQTVVPGLLLRYRDAVLSLVRKGVVVADISGIWDELLKRKRHLDLTGNGVNHPNDFGHRLYADVLNTLLIP